MKLKYLSLVLGVAWLFAAVLVPPVILPVNLEAKTRKGDKFLKEGRAAEAKGDWDAALELYEEAVDVDPANVEYLLAMRKARFQAGQKHVDAGEKLRGEGKLAEAMQEFQRALVADPASAIALQQIRRLQEMINRAPRSANPDDVGLTPAERERKSSDDRVNSMLAPPELKPMTLVIPTLKMNNQPPKVLFETVGKLAGVNIVFDSQFNAPARNFNVDLTNATPDQAFDYLALLTHTFWKPIAANAIFITEDNVTKRRDYEDDVVKVFYVTNATSVQEFQEIATAIRTVAEIRRVFTYNAQRAMIVRDTVDKVALAEKLVHDLDKPKAEVVVDVIVMEANSERTRDLAATIGNVTSTGVAAGLNLTASFNPGGAAAAGATAATSIPLSRIGKLSSNQWQTSLPGALLEAMLSDNRTRILNNPQVRASDGQKVTFKFGNRIPYATGSFQTNTASALVSTQFNYADVGVNVDMTPQVHSADELTMHIEVTVSSVQSYVSIGSIQQPVIGQRSNIADIRLREGEVNIMGGLSSNQDTHNISGLPGLVDIPVLGKFFGTDHNDRTHGELLIALIPHIVRTPDYTAENLRGIYAGTDQVVKLNYSPRLSNEVPTGPIGNTAPTNMNNAAPVLTAAAPAPAMPAAAPGSPVSLLPGGVQGVARLTFVPPLVQAASGSAVTATIQIDNLNNAAAASPIKIQFPRNQLRLDDVLAGDLFSGDGVQANLVKDIRNDSGEAVITITRPPGSPPVNGSGSAAVLKFTALGKGSASVKVTELGVKDPQGQPVATSPGEFIVNIP
jgi:general secretion pathway protein D